MSKYDSAYVNTIQSAIRSGIISERLFPLPPHVVNHPIISRYIGEEKRYKIVTAGRQSYKSEIAKRHLFREALKHPKHRYLVGMPVHQQVKSIYWSGPLNLVDMFPSAVVKKVSDTDMVLTLMNDTTIELFSADSVQRKEGSYAHGVILDECGDLDVRNVWQRSIAPMLTQTKGWIYFLGVPRQTMGIDYKEMFLEYSDSRKYPEWGTYTWHSADVLDASEIDRIKSMIDPITFQTEFAGQFAEKQGGLAYYRFNPNLHVQNLELDGSLPLMVTWDFNSGFMAPQIGQVFRNEFVYFHDQVVDRNTNVFKIAPKVKEKLKELNNNDEGLARKRKTFFYGDYAGFSENANAKGSAWDELRQLFAGWNIELRVKQNPVIDKRISSVNSRLQSADEKIHCTVSERCVDLIKDFKMVSYADLTKDKSKVGERTHASDSIGYMMYYHYPIRLGTLEQS